MHIPNEMLQGTVCPVTVLVSAMGVVIVALKAFWSEHKPGAARFGAVTAFIFAAQMINFPIAGATSGHLLGGVLAVALLGIPFGILSIALVVTVQCLVFSDGGFMMLGANVLNMAVIGAGLGGLVHWYLTKKASVRSSRYAIGLGLAAWVSVMIAALAVSIELAASGTIAFHKVAGAMLGTHALIGIGEGLITVAAYFLLSQPILSSSPKRSVTVPLVAAGIIAVMVSPFASGLPDGLEWVAAKYQLFHDASPALVSPLPDYTIPFISSEMLTTGIAGLVGVILTFLVAQTVARALNKAVRTETI